MLWYIAHIIMYIEPLNIEENSIVVDENFHLIKAPTIEKAWEKAEKIGKEGELLDTQNPLLRDDNVPVVQKFGGVRKIVSCLPDDERPKDQTEVTYSTYEVKNKKDLEKLINNKSVTIKYLE